MTLGVGHWYRGGDADQVTVDGPAGRPPGALAAVDFQDGQRYLVAANDGLVTVCGFTAAYSDELAALYAEAFGPNRRCDRHGLLLAAGAGTRMGSPRPWCAMPTARRG